jgi:hypothetical protein
MRRILLVVTVALVMAAMMVFSAVPAFAQECEEKDDKVECGPFDEFKFEENEFKSEAGPGCEFKFEEDEEKDECTGV